MLVKIISLAFSLNYDGFDDSEVQAFLVDKELVSVKEYFFVRNELPYLTLVIQYLPLRQDGAVRIVPASKRDDSWREALSSEDLGLFNFLRDWRVNRARREGVPPYVLFTNRQLAQIVKLRPQSLSTLKQVEGLGQAKLEKYGHEILILPIFI